MGDYERRIHNRLAAHPGKVRADAAAIAAEADAEIHSLRATYVALRKDAERYRWLRQREVEIRRYALVGVRASERIDDQIDAAIEEARAVGAA